MIGDGISDVLADLTYVVDREAKMRITNGTHCAKTTITFSVFFSVFLL
jgi:hypothetical protein